MSVVNPISEIVNRCLMPAIKYFDREHDDALYLLHRNLYVQTKSRINFYINGLISYVNPRRSLSLFGLELLPSQAIQNILDQMNRAGGYAVSVVCFPDSHLKSLIMKIDDCKAESLTSARKMLYDWTVLREEPLVQTIINDASIKLIADTYLDCNSILNMVTAWKTSYIDESSHNVSGDAMMFHFDADHNRFLKLFVYLSDVGKLEGPHVFIPRTSSAYRKELPDMLQRDGRFSNIDIIQYGLLPELILGSKGTLIFADTHCFHRGTRVAQGCCRYILQLQFVDSVAGAKPAHNLKDIIDMNIAFDNLP